MKPKDSNLFFTCSLIEFIGRRQKLRRSEVVNVLGKDNIKRIYDYADVFHCEPIEKVADDFINLASVPEGDFDNTAMCKYTVPDYWTIGDVYERLIEDINTSDIISALFAVYSSWISDSISDYNTDFFYQPRDYLSECYKQNKILED